MDSSNLHRCFTMNDGDRVCSRDLKPPQETRGLPLRRFAGLMFLDYLDRKWVRCGTSATIDVIDMLFANQAGQRDASPSVGA